MNNQKIGTFIKILRKEKNYTQKELAKKLNITDRAISKWERGLGCPDISLLEELSKILDISILEILKGEKIINNKEISKQDLINSMNLSKNNTLSKIKEITNIISIISVIIFISIIIITNFKSIHILNKKYTTKIEGYVYKDKEYYEEYNNKLNIILNNQGKVNDNDYILIKTYLNIINKELEKQNNLKYIEKDTYTYINLAQFYIDHSYIPFISTNYIDAYGILLEYNTSNSHNMKEYSKSKDIIIEEIINQLSFIEQPYSITNNLPYNNYYPNIHYFIELIYKKELMLLNDIIKVGEINES